MNDLTDYCNRNIVGKLAVTNLTENSDDRLKFNETEIINGIEVINQLTPKLYNKSQVLNIEEDTFKEAGLIAQDLQRTDLSFCVSGGDYIDFMGNNIERPYDVNYTSVLAYLIAAVKEQKSMIEELSKLIEK
jgi:hypothetical protein